MLFPLKQGFTTNCNTSAFHLVIKIFYRITSLSIKSHLIATVENDSAFNNRSFLVACHVNCQLSYCELLGLNQQLSVCFDFALIRDKLPVRLSEDCRGSHNNKEMHYEICSAEKHLVLIKINILSPRASKKTKDRLLSYYICRMDVVSCGLSIKQ